MEARGRGGVGGPDAPRVFGDVTTSEIKPTLNGSNGADGSSEHLIFISAHIFKGSNIRRNKERILTLLDSLPENRTALGVLPSGKAQKNVSPPSLGARG